jgi:hypothetical protein
MDIGTKDDIKKRGSLEADVPKSGQSDEISEDIHVIRTASNAISKVKMDEKNRKKDMDRCRIKRSMS